MKHVKIRFDLVPDEDGYPPFRAETVWARSSERVGVYVIDNIPFFTRDATVGDVVRARRSDGEVVFERVITPSPRSLIRVVVHDPSDANISTIRKELEGIGCSSEFFSPRMIGVDIPIDVSLEAVRGYLDELSKRDLVDYEEPILRHPQQD